MLLDELIEGAERLNGEALSDDVAMLLFGARADAQRRERRVSAARTDAVAARAPPRGGSAADRARPRRRSCSADDRPTVAARRGRHRAGAAGQRHADAQRHLLLDEVGPARRTAVALENALINEETGVRGFR